MNDRGFDLSREIERYVTRITKRIRSPKRRRAAAEEYTEHIRDLVYHYGLEGTSEEAAFLRAREALGDEDKIEELLAAIHNKDRLPSWLQVLIVAVSVAFVGSTYFWIDDYTYRSWFVVVLAAVFGAAAVIALCLAARAVRCLYIRRDAYRRLKKYAAEQGMRLIKNGNVYASLFRRASVPELTLETGRERYILYFWSTFRRKKTLRLFANGLYSYSDNVGYMFLPNQPGGLMSAGWDLFVPKGVKSFSLWNSETAQIPRGMHLMPSIDWQACERADRDNIRVILLNPIPMGVEGIEKGMPRKLGDDAVFAGCRIWSASGLLSYLEGLRIKGSKVIREES